MLCIASLTCSIQADDRPTAPSSIHTYKKTAVYSIAALGSLWRTISKARDKKVINALNHGYFAYRMASCALEEGKKERTTPTAQTGLSLPKKIGFLGTAGFGLVGSIISGILACKKCLTPRARLLNGYDALIYGLNTHYALQTLKKDIQQKNHKLTEKL